MAKAVSRPQLTAKGASTHTHTQTHTGFLPESDSALIVEFFKSTGITAAGGKFDFERCTRNMFEHRNWKRDLLMLLYLKRWNKKKKKEKKKRAKDSTGIHPVLAVRYLEGSFHTLFEKTEEP